MCGWDEDRTTGMSSLANEEPLVVVEARIDVMWEVIREDRGDSCDGVVRKGEAPLRRSRCRSFLKRSFSAEDGDVSCGRSADGHWGSEVFASWGGDKHVVGINGDVFVERGKKESVENFLSNSRRGGRHGR